MLSTLVRLSQEECQNDLGLTRLQASKIVRSTETANKQFGNSCDNTTIAEQLQTQNDALHAQLQTLENENTSLKAQVDALMKQRKPQTPQSQQKPSATTPTPSTPSSALTAAQPQKPPQKHELHVVKGAPGGASKGALLGVVGGAIAGDAGKGAKIGAAVGATGGAMQRSGARRRTRLARGR